MSSGMFNPLEIWSIGRINILEHDEMGNCNESELIKSDWNKSDQIPKAGLSPTISIAGLSPTVISPTISIAGLRRCN